MLKVVEACTNDRRKVYRKKREKVTVLQDGLPVEIETLTHTFRQLVMAQLTL